MQRHNAAALANLNPLEFDKDTKLNVAAAVGNYKDETAAAVGVYYRPNEDVMVGWGIYLFRHRRKYGRRWRFLQNRTWWQ